MLGRLQDSSPMASVASEEHSARQKPKVVYVMGAGRSGSTILGVALGNCAEVFFAGELDKWLARGGVPKRSDPERVNFWQAVRARVADPGELRRGHPHRYLERSSALVRFGRRRARRRLRKPYRRVASELYDAVSVVSGASYLVDSSHYPLRARELQSLDDIELYLLLLVRDPQDVVASFARDDVVERRFNPLTTRLYLLATYLLASWVFLEHPREKRMVLFYEDLLADPAGVIEDLLERIGSSSAPPDFSRLSTGIPLHGNRLIDEPSVSLQPLAPRRGGASASRLFAVALRAALGRLHPRVSARSPGERPHSQPASAAR